MRSLLKMTCHISKCLLGLNDLEIPISYNVIL